MADQVVENWLEKLKLTEAFQIVSLAGLVIFLILAGFGQRKTWIATEVILATVVGLTFAVFPKQVLMLQTEGTLGDTEVALASFFGVTFMSSGVMWYRTKETRDGTVPITLMMSRVFTSSTLLMAQTFAYFLQTKTTVKNSNQTGVVWSFQMLLLMLPTTLWLLGNLLHLSRSHDFNTYPQHNIRLNNHLRFDGWFMLLIGAAWLAFPQQITGALLLKKSNKIALHVGRSIGTLYFGDGIISLQASGFLHERDKKALFLTRILANLFQFVLIAVLHSFFNLLTLNGIGCAAVVASPVLLNALIGYFCGGTTVYHFPTPKKNDDKVE